jgi:hypothetical protein
LSSFIGATGGNKLCSRALFWVSFKPMSPKTGICRGSLVPLIAPQSDDNAVVTAVVHSASSF